MRTVVSLLSTILSQKPALVREMVRVANEYGADKDCDTYSDHDELTALMSVPGVDEVLAAQFHLLKLIIAFHGIPENFELNVQSVKRWQRTRKQPAALRIVR